MAHTSAMTRSPCTKYFLDTKSKISMLILAMAIMSCVGFSLGIASLASPGHRLRPRANLTAASSSASTSGTSSTLSMAATTLSSPTPYTPEIAFAIQYPFNTAAKIIIPLSLPPILLNITPLIWHIRNHNIPTASLITWAILLNLINFLNAIIWPRDNISQWYHGRIFCDIELRIMVGAVFGGGAGAVLCLAKSLAGILDIERQTMEKRKQYVHDGLLCFGLPVWFMIIYWFVQNGRYYIEGVWGCDDPMDRSWLSIVLMQIWPILFLCISLYYAGLVLVRLFKYRMQVSTLLQNNRTTRKKFMRLFFLALFIIVPLLPLNIVQLVTFINWAPMHPYSWNAVHRDWNYALMVPSYLVPSNHPDRWFWILEGWATFLLLGLGDETMKFYKQILVSISFRRFFPSLEQGTSLGSQMRMWFSSKGSRTKLLFGKNNRSRIATNDSLDSSTISRASTLFSKQSTWSKISPELPTTEPKLAIQPTNKSATTIISHNVFSSTYTTTAPPSKRSKLSLFAQMPTFGQAFAGVAPPLQARTMESKYTTSRRDTRSVASKILISVPSPTIGALDDDLILQMVGAAPLDWKGKGKAREDWTPIMKLEALRNKKLGGASELV